MNPEASIFYYNNSVRASSSGRSIRAATSRARGLARLTIYTIATGASAPEISSAPARNGPVGSVAHRTCSTGHIYVATTSRARHPLRSDLLRGGRQSRES